MTFSSKYDIGQFVEFNSSSGGLKSGEITGVFVGADEIQYEINSDGFTDEANITALYTKQNVQSTQLELPVSVSIEDFPSGAV